VLVEAESSFAGSHVNQLASLSSSEDLIRTKEESVGISGLRQQHVNNSDEIR
jgi:hypothetical protein